MSVSHFFMPVQNIIGPGALDEALQIVGKMGFRKALIVTDPGLSKIGVANTVSDKLAAQGANDGLWDWDLRSGQLPFAGLQIITPEAFLKEI